MPKKGYKQTREHKRKISDVTTGENNPFYNKHHNKQSKKKQLDTKNKNGTILRGKKHPMYGSKRPDLIERNLENNPMTIKQFEKRLENE